MVKSQAYSIENIAQLQAMEAIFKQVQRDIFRKFLRQSETSEAIADLIQEADELA